MPYLDTQKIIWVDDPGHHHLNIQCITLRKSLRIRSVISVNYHYITVLCPFDLLIRLKCYNYV